MAKHKKPTTPTTVPVYTPPGVTPGTTNTKGAQAPLPAAFAKKYGLKYLVFTPPPSATNNTPHAPASGKELWEAINQAVKAGELSSVGAQELRSMYFPAGFTGTGKGSSTVFTAVSGQLGSNGWSLIGLTAPNVPAGGSTKGVPVPTIVKMFQDMSQMYGSAISLGISQSTASQEANAFGVVAQYLDSWGLAKDANIVYRMIMKSGDHLINHEAILEAVRGNAPSGLGPQVDAQLKANYNASFPGLASYNQQPGAIHMTEQAYQNYSAAVLNSATQYGAPMPTQKEVGQLLNNHVSASEYQQRVVDIAAAVNNADPQTKQLLQSEYGINQQDLMHYMIHGNLPDLQRKVASAEIQDYAGRVGLKGLSQTGAEQLADMAKLSASAGNNPLGAGVSQIQQSLQTAARDVALTASAPGAGTPTVDTNTLIASQIAGFGGQNQTVAQTQVARAEQAKAAPFEKGGGFEETGKGVIGLGAART